MIREVIIGMDSSGINNWKLRIENWKLVAYDSLPATTSDSGIDGFYGLLYLGLVTYFTIPVSLLPDIAIPEITVQISGQNTSARELENTVVKPVRLQLMQVAGLRDIHSETRDGAGIIRLSFDFGTNTDLAFIEVNEKIDAAMNYLPREVERPRVVKASATDIPVFCLNLTLKTIENDAAFLDLCQFAETVIQTKDWTVAGSGDGGYRRA